MARYRVGQKRAVSELRRFPGLILAAPAGGNKPKSSGGRKADQYELVVEDVIGDIQDMIGYTSWGFPYATREQIADSLGLTSSGMSYPGWLLDPMQKPDVRGNTPPQLQEVANRTQKGVGDE
jgi:hypothetical protein